MEGDTHFLAKKNTRIIFSHSQLDSSGFWSWESTKKCSVFVSYLKIRRAWIIDAPHQLVKPLCFVKQCSFVYRTWAINVPLICSHLLHSSSNHSKLLIKWCLNRKVGYYEIIFPQSIARAKIAPPTSSVHELYSSENLAPWTIEHLSIDPQGSTSYVKKKSEDQLDNWRRVEEWGKSKFLVGCVSLKFHAPVLPLGTVGLNIDSSEDEARFSPMGLEWAWHRAEGRNSAEEYKG